MAAQQGAAKAEFERVQTELALAEDHMQMQTDVADMAHDAQTEAMRGTVEAKQRRAESDLSQARRLSGPGRTRLSHTHTYTRTHATHYTHTHTHTHT